VNDQNLLKYITSIAKWYAGKCPSVTVEELITEGYLGYRHAQEKFDESRGVPLLGYAHNWIKAYMINYCKKAVHPLGGADSEHPPALCAYDEAEGNLDDMPHKAGMMRHIESLSERTTPEDLVDAKSQRELAKERLTLIKNDRTLKVVKARFFEEKTLTQIGKELSVSKERVRQIEISAIKNMRVNAVNVIPDEKLQMVSSLLSEGKSIREIERISGVSKNTITKYKEKLNITALCKCGRPAGHKEWCSERVKNSEKRQALIASWRKLSSEQIQEYIKAINESETLGDAAAKLGISRWVLNKWREKYPDIGVAKPHYHEPDSVGNKVGKKPDVASKPKSCDQKISFGFKGVVYFFGKALDVDISIKEAG
jgi:RNA polymerase sigma factor (sigma-70 family)